MRSALECRTVGSTVLVHRKGKLDGAAWRQAQRLAADPEHTVVVVDLPDGSPITVWESVVKALRRRGGSIRLVTGRDGAAAGQWLADSLCRPVVAADGVSVSSACGGLYVLAGTGAGWIRFEPGRLPRKDSQRFPKLCWQSSTVDEIRSVSEHAVSEPLPGGVWIRRVAQDPRRPELRRRLIEDLLCRDDRFAVVLGSPGGPPLSLDDVAGFWACVPPESRAAIRFVPYGPVEVPEGLTLGQALADRLAGPVAVYTGLPSQASDQQGTEVHVVRPDGSLGWEPFVKEVAYSPAQTSHGPAVRYVVDHRPVPGLPELTPGVYRYGADAVLEIIQSGLWMRSPEPAPCADAVRGLPVDTDGLTVVFDDSSPRLAERMRHLARDVVARLDEATRRACRVVSTSKVFTEATADQHWLADGTETVALAGIGVCLPVSAAPDEAADAVWSTDEPEGAEFPVVVGGDAVDTSPAPSEPAEAITPVAVGEPAVPMAAPTLPAPVFVPTTTSAAAASATIPAAMPTGFRLESAPEQLVPELDPFESMSSALTTVTPGCAEGNSAMPLDLSRVQPVPTPAACAVPPAKGLHQERLWLRTTLSAQYDSVTNSVAGVLSRTPGLRQGTDDSAVLADLVAVRLYLSAPGKALDDAVRTGRPGPHVPFARCVASGLRRLPSYRGPVVLHVTLDDAQWRWYQDTTLLTEWACLAALTEPHAGLTGDVELRIWSMTARRTALLAPEPAARVVFLPGTGFKVLRVDDGPRRTVLMRELTTAEIGPEGQVPDDDPPADRAALSHLDSPSWSGEPAVALTAEQAARFDHPPGLLAAEEGTT